LHICPYACRGSPVTSPRPGTLRAGPWPLGRSVPRIADQRLARPEQYHQEDAGHTQHGKYRLVQQPLDAVPEPGRITLDPGPESLLTGLMDVVPELAKPGETQGLIRHKARAVIDHEDESAGQE